ncbi:phosphoribosylanthranilate isomerase [Spongiimicrobium sp. 3-5]|uniref:phosphoribosylanthranilate isomerase n=1 Tax=Spongiimicrobium sp. 3-5 TaxID=3332596 RepID=UPI0039806D46
MKLKVCGMKFDDNIKQVAALQPDYLGFIFWEPSKRFFDKDMPNVPGNIKKVGVFVDATIANILEKCKNYSLVVVQLHGKESPEFCKELKNRSITILGREIEIVKVFSIRETFKFSILEPYENVCDFFMFDTKGKLPGGNGYTFKWEVLKKYPSTKPFFLSGGIGLEEVSKVADFLQTKESKYCHAIDVNSRFETEPGNKNIEKLEKFKTMLAQFS